MAQEEPAADFFRRPRILRGILALREAHPEALDAGGFQKGTGYSNGDFAAEVRHDLVRWRLATSTETTRPILVRLTPTGVKLADALSALDAMAPGVATDATALLVLLFLLDVDPTPAPSGALRDRLGYAEGYRELANARRLLLARKLVGVDEGIDEKRHPYVLTKLTPQGRRAATLARRAAEQALGAKNAGKSRS